MAEDMMELPDGRQAQVWHGGLPTGPLVVYLHGTPESRLGAATGDAAAVRTGVHLVAVNRPGYGRSDPAESGLASVADDTVAVADRLGVHRFAVLGSSGGGPYALACAARHPARVAAVGIASGPGEVTGQDPPRITDKPEDDDDRAARERLDAGDEAGAIEIFSASIRQGAEHILGDDPVEVVARFCKLMPPAEAELIKKLPPAEIAASIREGIGRPGGYVRDALALIRPWEIRPEDVQAPTWLWYGTADENVPIRHGRWLAERLPHATLVVREGEGHVATSLLHWDDMLATLRDAMA